MSKCNHQWALAFTKMRYVHVCRKCNEMEDIEDQDRFCFDDIDFLIFNADDISEKNQWKL